MLEYGITSVQGARDANEDRAQCFVEGNGFKWFAVHDGHGGEQAVDKIVAWVTTHQREWRRKKLMQDQNEEPGMMKDMAQAYFEMEEALREEKSGAVSVTAVCTKKAIYFAWMGDCEGCVFDAQTGAIAESRGPAYNCMIDFAEVEETQRSMICSQTIAHRFASKPRMQPLSSTTRVDGVCTMYQHYRALSFPDLKTQEELRKIQQRSPNEIICVDVTEARVGTQMMLLDVRLSNSIQPTRALGDGRETLVLRQPAVLCVRRATAANGRKARQNILMCSDGAFDRYAFANLQAVCQCFANPLEFVQKQFYRGGQEITERLTANNTLPTALAATTWPEFIVFLREQHMPALIAIAANDEQTWLRACYRSMLWLQNNPLAQDEGMSCFMGTHIVAHLAVLMGSMDNVTVLVALKA